MAGRCMEITRKGYNVPTLCWKCANSYAHKCSKFAKPSKPVEGWEIKPCRMKTGINNGKGLYVDTYEVINCPNFEQERKNINEEDKLRLIAVADKYFGLSEYLKAANGINQKRLYG